MRLPVKERGYAEKRDAAMATDPVKRAGWRRLCVRLLELAGHSAKFNSQESVQFYAADGKYRMQVFSLQDVVGGELTLHCRDVLDTLLQKKVVRPAKPDPVANRYVIAGTDVSVVIERVPQQAAEHPAAFRDMLSWNRKCMRIDLPIGELESIFPQLDNVLSLSLPTPKA